MFVEGFGGGQDVGLVMDMMKRIHKMGGGQYCIQSERRRKREECKQNGSIELSDLSMICNCMLIDACAKLNCSQRFLNLQGSCRV